MKPVAKRSWFSLGLMLLIVASASIVGLLSRYYFLDVPEYGRLCGSANPPWWCMVREIVITPQTYLVSLVCALIAVYRASLAWSLMAIATGVLGLFSFNPAWSMAYPDWSIAGLFCGLLAFMRVRA